MVNDLKPVVIRPAQPRDVNVMAEIARSAMQHPWSRAIFADCFKEDYHGFVITQGELANQVIGFSVVLIQLQECQLLNVCVRARHQGCGYGRQLLLHIIEYSKQNKVKKIFLETRRSNEKAIQCYKSAGFNQVAERRDYYLLEGGREDALIFSLKL